MTGRAAGFCAGTGAPGYARGVPGRGFGRGCGMGRGMGRGGFAWGGFGFRNPFRGFGATPWQQAAAPRTEAESLKDQAKFLSESLADVQQRLSELESTQTK